MTSPLVFLFILPPPSAWCDRKAKKGKLREIWADELAKEARTDGRA